MTRVNSLNGITFENFKYDTVFYATDGTTDYQLTYDELKQAARINFRGAAWVQVNCEGSAFVWRAFAQAAAPSSVQYDTCSVTDPNSVGCFYFNQAPDFDYAIFGWNFILGGASETEVYLCNSAGGGTGVGPLAPTRTIENRNNLGAYGMSCPIPVSSGDQFSLIIDPSVSEYIRPETLESGAAVFWMQALS